MTSSSFSQRLVRPRCHRSCRPLPRHPFSLRLRECSNQPRCCRSRIRHLRYQHHRTLCPSRCCYQSRHRCPLHNQQRLLRCLRSRHPHQRHHCRHRCSCREHSTKQPGTCVNYAENTTIKNTSFIAGSVILNYSLFVRYICPLYATFVC
jgi:hypothetical protein